MKTSKTIKNEAKKAKLKAQKAKEKAKLLKEKEARARARAKKKRLKEKEAKEKAKIKAQKAKEKAKLLKEKEAKKKAKADKKAQTVSTKKVKPEVVDLYKNTIGELVFVTSLGEEHKVLMDNLEGEDLHKLVRRKLGKMFYEYIQTVNIHSLVTVYNSSDFEEVA